MNKSLIESLVKSMEIKKGEIVLVQLWGENEYTDVQDNFCTAISAIGAAPVKFQHSRIFYKNIFEALNEADNIYPDEYFKIFEPVNIVIDLMAYRPATPHPEFPKEKLEKYRSYMIRLMTALSCKEKLIQLTIPTEETANEAGFDFNDFKEILGNAYSVDYGNLKIKCKDTIEKLNCVSHIEIKTGDDKCLTFSVENRNWYTDDGNGDFPSGEVYIAPKEDSANGELFIDRAFFEGQVYENLILRFKDGKLQSSNSDKLNETFCNLPDNSDVLCEFGIGLNDKITHLTGYTPADEKAIDTYHIGFGMNSMFGGQNLCNYHSDIVFKGDIYADGNLL